MSAKPVALVTGALGFLGRHLVQGLAEHGYRTVGLDVRDGADHRLDLAADDLAPLLAAVKPVLVVHAAGPASVPRSLIDPQGDFEGTVRCTARVLDAVRREAAGTRLIYLSSAAVYGSPTRLPVRETAALKPVSPYGYHKLDAEMLVREHTHLHGLRAASLRIFSAYGAGLARQVLWDIASKAVTGDTVQLAGTGAESRDFVHARDVAQAVCVVGERAKLKGEVYNVASGAETRIDELAARVVAAVAPGRAVRFTGQVRAGDPLRWHADVTRLRALGFVPGVTLAEGVREFAAWFSAQRGDSR